MKNRPLASALRLRAFGTIARRLAIEPLETRRLLASLTSQLPPIVISVGSEPVQVRTDADPSKEITLSSATVGAMEELAILQRSFSAGGLYHDDNGLLAYLQQSTWSKTATPVKNESVEQLELEAAIELANQGFQIISPSPTLAAEQIFGSSPSEIEPIPRLANTSNTRASLSSTDLALPVLDQKAAETSPAAAGSSTDAKPEREPETADEVETADATKLVQEDKQGEREITSVELEAVQRLTVVDEENLDGTVASDRTSKTNDMLLLPQPPAGAPVARDHDASRANPDSPSAVEGAGSKIVSTGQEVLDQMLLLPMVPDSGADHEDAGPALLAGFNPVAMLQIFVGSDFDDVRVGQFESREGLPPEAHETDVASLPFIRRDRLAAAVCVILVGYWYFHPIAECVLPGQAGLPATNERGLGHGVRNPFWRRRNDAT